MKYTDLHIHTEYTKGNGITKIPDLVMRAKELGMTSLAITDSGNTDGFKEFVTICNKESIKPILGCGFYFAPLGLQLKETHHLVLIAKHREGYKNLLNLVEFSKSTGMSCKPRIDLETLREHSKGLICLTGGLGGVFDKPYIDGNKHMALDNIQSLKSIFGDDLYLELQDNDLELNRLIAHEILELSKKMNIKTVVTGGSFYLTSSDALECNRVRECSGNRPLKGSGYFFKSLDQIRIKFRHCKTAIANSGLIADIIDCFELD